MRHRKKFLLAGGILVVLVLIFIALAGSGVEVETVEAHVGDITRTVEDTGYVQPTTDYKLFSTQGAKVLQIPVEVGERVERGQTLVIMENPDLAAQIAETQTRLSQAEATVTSIRAALERYRLELEDAKKNLARIQELYASGAATRVDLEQAMLAVDTGEKTLQEQTSLLENARQQVSSTSESLKQLKTKEQQLVVTSPAGGIILDLPVRQGQVLSPGEPLVTVAPPGNLEIKADILSDDLAEIRENQKVLIDAPVLGGKTLTGKVTKIYPRAEEKVSALGVIQRRVPVIISLPDPANLKPGYEVRVCIETVSRRDVLLVPREAVLTTPDGGKRVMVVTGGNRVEHRPVETGVSDGERIEITNGLTKGERVIRDGSLDLKENTRVKQQYKTWK